MRDDPNKEFIVSFIPGSDIEEDPGKFFLRITDMDVVQFQKNKHRMCPDPFVSVDEGVVAGKTETESGCFLIDRRK